MNVIRDLNINNDSMEYFNSQSVITEGTFDGLHLGHKKIIEKLTSTAREHKLRKVIVTFEPHPRLVLNSKNKQGGIRILTTLEEKISLFKSLQIDKLIIINFTEKFATTSATEFYRKYLIEKIGLSYLVVGYDHMFGRNREGSFVTLKSIAKDYKFEVIKVNEFRQGGNIVSSSLIRKYLSELKVKEAAELLGRNYSISGKIIYGEKRGIKIGFPTANLKPDIQEKLIPGNGVYLVKVYLNHNYYFGMMNVGFRPTVNSGKNIFLETHIFDFDKDVYGETMKVEFLEYIREERKFDSLDKLKEQIEKDKKYIIEKLTYLNN